MWVYVGMGGCLCAHVYQYVNFNPNFLITGSQTALETLTLKMNFDEFGKNRKNSTILITKIA